MESEKLGGGEQVAFLSDQKVLPQMNYSAQSPQDPARKQTAENVRQEGILKVKTELGIPSSFGGDLQNTESKKSDAEIYALFEELFRGDGEHGLMRSLCLQSWETFNEWKDGLDENLKHVGLTPDAIQKIKQIVSIGDSYDEEKFKLSFSGCAKESFLLEQRFLWLLKNDQGVMETIGECEDALTGLLSDFSISNGKKIGEVVFLGKLEESLKKKDTIGFHGFYNSEDKRIQIVVDAEESLAQGESALLSDPIKHTMVHEMVHSLSDKTAPLENTQDADAEVIKKARNGISSFLSVEQAGKLVRIKKSLYEMNEGLTDLIAQVADKKVGFEGASESYTEHVRGCVDFLYALQHWNDSELSFPEQPDVSLELKKIAPYYFEEGGTVKLVKYLDRTIGKHASRMFDICIGNKISYRDFLLGVKDQESSREPKKIEIDSGLESSEFLKKHGVSMEEIMQLYPFVKISEPQMVASSHVDNLGNY